MQGRLGWQVHVASQPGSPLQISPFSQSAFAVQVLAVPVSAGGATAVEMAGDVFDAELSLSGGGVADPHATTESAKTRRLHVDFMPA